MAISPFVQPRSELLANGFFSFKISLPIAKDGFHSFQFVAVIGGHICNTYGPEGGANITPARGRRVPCDPSLFVSIAGDGDEIR
jgi:hypothetical protein